MRQWSPKRGEERLKLKIGNTRLRRLVGKNLPVKTCSSNVFLHSCRDCRRFPFQRSTRIRSTAKGERERLGADLGEVVLVREVRPVASGGREAGDADLSERVYRYLSYRYTGISNSGIPVRNCPVPVFPTCIFSKCKLHSVWLSDFLPISGIPHNSSKIQWTFSTKNYNLNS